MPTETTPMIIAQLKVVAMNGRPERLLIIEEDIVHNGASYERSDYRVFLNSGVLSSGKFIEVFSQLEVAVQFASNELLRLLDLQK